MRQGQSDGETIERQFVVLRHELPDDAATPSHWDLMIESDDQLATWRLMSDWNATERQPAVRIADHGLTYLDFEGPLSGDRGSVQQIERGTLAVERWTSGRIEGTLSGWSTHTRLLLQRNADSSEWTIEFVRSDAEK